MTRDEIEALLDEMGGMDEPGPASPYAKHWELERRMAAALRTLAQENEALRQDRDLCERTRTNMRRILNDVAEALKGSPAPLHAHDWSGLPALVRELRADKERLDWLDRVVQAGLLGEVAERMPRIWDGDLRSFIDKASVAGYATLDAARAEENAPR